MEMSVEPALIRVRVIDTGRGIDPQHLSQIFDRFYSAPDHSDRDRTGLGLAIVKRIMDLHGQSVRILSEQGLARRLSSREAGRHGSRPG